VKVKAPPLAGFIETGVGLGILAALNLLWWPDDPAFASFRFHPYWMVVLPMAVYYGFKEAAVAAVACAGLYIVWTWYQAPEPYWLLFFNFQRLYNPVLFLAVGLVLGELRESHRRRERMLKDKLEQLDSALQDLAVRHLSLSEANRELEVRILSQDQTVQTLYEAAEGLKELDEEAILPAVTKILVEHLGVAGASIYRLEEDRFERVGLSGKVNEGQAPPIMPSDEGLMSAALLQRQAATVKMLLSQKEIPSFSREPILISAPLILEDGQLYGVINVHSLPFIRFTAATVRMVGLLADWASIALTNARKLKAVADKNIADDLTGAYTPEYLTRRLAEEFARAKRHRMALSLIMVKAVDYDSIEEALKPDILSVLGLVFSKSVRDIDLIFRYSGSDTFVLLLPATPLAGCRVVAERLLNEINAFNFHPYSDPQRPLDTILGVAEFVPGMKESEELLAWAEKEMEG